MATRRSGSIFLIFFIQRTRRTHLKQENINIDENINFSSQSIDNVIAKPNKTPSKKALDILYRYQNGLIGTLLFLAALGFNLYRLGTPSIWFDEAYSIELARQPLPLLWHLIFGPEPNMELYYLFLHFWLQFTGALGLIPKEFLVRLPSAIFAALSPLVPFTFSRPFICLSPSIHPPTL